MSFGCTGGHHDPVQIFLFDDLGHGFLGVLGTGIQVVTGIHHIGQRLGIFGHRRHIDDTGDINAAAADKYADPRPFIGDIGFRYNFRDFGFAVAGGTQYFTGRRRRRTGIHHSLGDVLGSLKGAANIDAFFRSGHRIKGVGFAEIAGRQFKTQTLGQLDCFGGCLQSHRQHDHIEGFQF